MTDEQTTGTPAQDDGDAAAQSPTTGTPGADDRDADSSEPDYKALYLASKSKVEEANRLKAENEALKMRAPQPPAAEDDDDALDHGNDAPAMPKTDWNKVRDYAERGDPVAAAQIENRIMLENLARQTLDEFSVREMDADERAEVQRHYKRNRHRLGDIKAAAAEVRASKLSSEVEKLRQELAAATKQPPKDVVRTHAREVTSSEAKTREMSTADYDAQVARLRADGRWSEARALGRKLASGEIDLKR